MQPEPQPNSSKQKEVEDLVVTQVTSGIRVGLVGVEGVELAWEITGVVIWGEGMNFGTLSINTAVMGFVGCRMGVLAS